MGWFAEGEASARTWLARLQGSSVLSLSVGLSDMLLPFMWVQKAIMG